MIYFFPFAMDIVVSLLLFVGRHSMASMGASEAVVGSIPLLYGIGYVLSGFVMRAIISRRHAKMQMLVAMFMLAGISAGLARLSTLDNLLLIQILFCLFPFGTSLFFNAFQAYMLGISKASARPLAMTVAIYTFAWSMGFGLGPFVCGFMKSWFSWSQTYYIAAFVSVVMAIIVLAYNPKPKAEPAAAEVADQACVGPLLHVPGWVGVLIGLIGWLIIATYWPVIAGEKGVSANVRGLVEFFYATAQGIAALMLIGLGNWQRKPWLLPVFGLLAIGSLLVFGIARAPGLFILGAILMGCYTATTFMFAIFHCMLDDAMASKRIAVNEMVVGAGYIIGPAIAGFLHKPGTPFLSSMVTAAAIIAVLIVGQTVLALALTKTKRQAG